MAAKEVVVFAVLIGLALVFLLCLVMLICVCKTYFKKCRQPVEPASGTAPALEAGDFRLHPNIEQILMRDLLMDSCECESQCLAILRSCHRVTEMLAAIAVSLVHKQHKLRKVAEVARQTSDRVDDLVRSMRPPVDSRLLEARASILVLTVSHLATLMRFAYKHNQSVTRDIERELASVDPFLQELRTAARRKNSATLLTGDLNVSSPSS
ncbi:transmembrane protein 98-like [Cloeon dipterum]|uniref:transmembrane protein 98-like n=1 Tax=Cloeon dipterum TaxID=197152 RepID=UPI00321FF79C